MSKKYEVICPVCGRRMIIVISGDDIEYIDIASCDIEVGSVKESDYEFGEKGGECDG